MMHAQVYNENLKDLLTYGIAPLSPVTSYTFRSLLLPVRQFTQLHAALYHGNNRVNKYSRVLILSATAYASTKDKNDTTVPLATQGTNIRIDKLTAPEEQK
jgi:hypothetical protein